MVYVMLADGFEEIEALAVVDILRRAEVDVKTVSVYNQKSVTGSHNISVNADIMLDEIDDNYNMIILPGGMPGTINLKNNETLENILKDAYKNGKYLAAICAAPMIYGELGFLSGKKATCFPSFEKHLNGAIFKLDSVCFDGNIITSRGAGTAHEFAFKIVEILKSKDVANELRVGMLYA